MQTALKGKHQEKTHESEKVRNNQCGAVLRRKAPRCHCRAGEGGHDLLRDAYGDAGSECEWLLGKWKVGGQVCL